MIAALQAVTDEPVPESLTTALKTELSGGEQLFLLDLVREHRFVHLSNTVGTIADEHLDRQTRWGPVHSSTEERLDRLAWTLSTQWAKFQASYERGEFARGVSLLSSVDETLEEIETIETSH